MDFKRRRTKDIGGRPSSRTISIDIRDSNCAIYITAASKNRFASLENKPSWYIVANNDQAVPPDLQRDLSKRIGATTIVLESSHVAMISHVKEVLDVITEAAANSSTSSPAKEV